MNSSLPDVRETGIQDKDSRVRDSGQGIRIPKVSGRKLTRDHRGFLDVLT